MGKYHINLWAVDEISTQFVDGLPEEGFNPFSLAFSEGKSRYE